MNKYILKFRSWYEQCQTRERLLVIVLCWAILYGFFSVFFFKSLEYKQTLLVAQVKQSQSQLDNWKTQIDALNKISESPLYKQWLSQHKLFQRLEAQYKYLLNTSSSKQWQDVIKTILRSQNNITLVQIKNSPETLYNQANVGEGAVKIYQQQLLLVINANFFDTVSYIQQLEEILPNIHWIKLDYQVTQYPMAKIEMEFSILYEKTS